MSHDPSGPRRLAELAGFVGEDGAHIQELAGRSTGLLSHSLAVITHPPGTGTINHHHRVADEVYFVWTGRGTITLDAQTHELAPGDVVEIRPGQRHKLWNDGPADLVLIVSCAPAYQPGEVVWDE